MTPRKHDSPDTPASEAADAAMDAIVERLGRSWLEVRDATIVILIDAKGGDKEESCVVMARKSGSEPTVNEVVVALVAGASAALKTVGQKLHIVPIGGTNASHN